MAVATKTVTAERAARALLDAIICDSDTTELRVLLDWKSINKGGTPVKTRKGTPNVAIGNFVSACALVINGSDYTEEMLETAQKILRAFLVPNLITTVDGESLYTLFRFCLETARNPTLLESAVISIGYGASVEEPSLRTTMYAKAGLQVLQNLHDQGLPVPRLRLFTGQTAGITVNGFNPEAVWPITLSSFAITAQYVWRFFSAVAHRVFFDFDRELDDAANRVVTAFAKHLRTSSSDTVRQIAEVMAERGSRHGDDQGRANSLRYTALHPVMFGCVLLREGIISPWLHRVVQDGTAPEWFLSIGGYPEQHFNLARESCVSVASRLPGINVTVTNMVRMTGFHGQVPVYYPLAGEPRFTDAFDLTEKPDVLASWVAVAEADPRLRLDYTALLGKEKDRYLREKNLRDYLEWAATASLPLEYARLCSGNNGRELIAAAIVGSRMARMFLGSQNPAAILSWDEITSMLNRLETLSEERIRMAVVASRQELTGTTDD